ncbi:MAG: hypothetical protein JJU16_07220 [Alkalibacterium sp.]|nr:hypothetical protein [Alkalibacterium sp.]
MVKAILLFSCLFILGGCSDSGIVTESNRLQEYIEEEDTAFHDDIAIYFEREQYAFSELDELFYVIENNSGQPIEISNHYSIEKYNEESWIDIEHHEFRSETKIKLLPDDQTEQLVWLSFDEEEIEKGIYRLTTTVHYPDKTEAARRVFSSQPAVNKEMSVLFEIR